MQASVAALHRSRRFLGWRWADTRVGWCEVAGIDFASSRALGMAQGGALALGSFGAVFLSQSAFWIAPGRKFGFVPYLFFLASSLALQTGDPWQVSFLDLPYGD